DNNILFVKEEILQKSNEEKICRDTTETSKLKHIALLADTKIAGIKITDKEYKVSEKSQPQNIAIDKTS
ncbi:10797_t:CDS:1, partial [Dentiscutata heterogama]